MSNRDLAERLCTASAALAEARIEHLAKFGTLIPHVFMGDVLARLGECMCADGKAPRVRDAPEIAAILDSLEDGMESADRETRNVVATAFAAGAERQPYFAALLPLLGRRIRAELGADGLT
jgi:hypothetical protein